MRYVIGIVIAGIFIIILQKYIPNIDPLSQGGFLIYSPVVFILFMTFYSSTGKSNNTKADNNSSTKIITPEPLDILIEENSDLLTPNYIHLLSKAELPEPILNLSSYDVNKYSTLIKDLNHFSVNTKDELKQLLVECKDSVLENASEKWENILVETQAKIEYYTKEGGYMVAKSYQEELEKWKKKQTIISNIGFFNLALKTKFKDEALEYFKNKNSQTL